MNDFYDFIDKFSLLKDFYDYIRVVDIKSKKIINIQDKTLKLTGESCFNFWSKGDSCENCIAARAYKQNTTLYKFENNFDSPFLVIASPLKIDNDVYIVEMLKNIKDTDLLIDWNSKTPNEIESIIANINKRAKNDMMEQN